MQTIKVCDVGLTRVAFIDNHSILDGIPFRVISVCLNNYKMFDNITQPNRIENPYAYIGGSINTHLNFFIGSTIVASLF